MMIGAAAAATTTAMMKMRPQQVCSSYLGVWHASAYGTDKYELIEHVQPAHRELVLAHFLAPVRANG